MQLKAGAAALLWVLWRCSERLFSWKAFCDKSASGS